MNKNNHLFQLKNISIEDEKALVKKIKTKDRGLWSKDDIHKYKTSMFKIIAERRIEEILKLLNNFTKLSNRSNYIIDHKILNQCQTKLENEVTNTFSKFKSYIKYRGLEANKKSNEMKKMFNEIHDIIDMEMNEKINKVLNKKRDDKNYEIKVFKKKTNR